MLYGFPGAVHKGSAADASVAPVRLGDAGYVLHDAFALALARGQAIGDALGFAWAAAALECTRPGNRAGAPTAEELEAFLEERA